MNKEKLMIEITRLTKLPSWMDNEETVKKVAKLGAQLWLMTDEIKPLDDGNVHKGKGIRVIYPDGQEQIFVSRAHAKRVAKISEITIRKYLDTGQCDSWGRMYESY